jgi:hypothetical protein
VVQPGDKLLTPNGTVVDYVEVATATDTIV